MGICKSRAPVPANVAAPSVPDPAAVQASDKLEVAEKVTQNLGASTVALPTTSWRALLQDQPLNADARPFTPDSKPLPPAPSAAARRRGPPPQPARARPGLPPSKAAAPPEGPAALATPAAADEPEWMQYLSKRLHAHAPPPSTAPPPPEQAAARGSPPWQSAASGRGRRAAAADARSGPGRGGGGEGGAGAGTSHVVIQTDTYLKLLKEGTSKNKTPNAAANRTAAKAVKQSDVSMPMTASGLASKWSSVLGGRQDDAVEEPMTNRSTQDDMWIDKMLVDQDLSDPAYHSETESIDAKSSASVHRFGRQPRVTPATIRKYVMQDLNCYLDQAVGMMLFRLQRFTDQQRSLFVKPNGGGDPAQSQQQQHRRFVIGLKEVARRTKQAKLECVIVAPDIEEDGHSGGLDDRMRELLAAAYQNATPVIFALSRARLGKALGKSLHISVLGVLDTRGARALLAQATRLATEGQQTWLARLEG